jgi:adenylate cyclase
LNGKAVLIGWIATGLIDEIATPLHLTCPGVVVHGVIFNSIITGNFLYRAPVWSAVVLTLLMGLLVTFVSNYFQGLNALFVTLGIVAAYTLLNCLVGYDWRKIEIDSAGPMMAATLIWPGCTLYHYLMERTERTKITNRFSSYVDPSLVNYVLEHPDVESFAGERRELSVVFTDLAGFTQLSEMLKEETVPLLNEYLGRMVPIIGRHHGLVNKFLGDGIMFFFGAPEPYPGDESLHAWASVQAVMEMQEAMISFNEDMARRNLPQLHMRAGISTGEMTVGDAGNPPQRSDYTVLGDRVNFASRLESANKFTGTRVLISDRTVELLRGTYLVRPIGRLQVVGKREPVMTYEPLAPIEKATEEMHKLVEMTKEVTDAYEGGRFAFCAAAAKRLELEFGTPSQGKFCELYLRLCAEYIETPPMDFLGQIKLEAK